MISDTITPNKSQLIKRIQQMNNSKIEVLEIVDGNTLNTNIPKLKNELRKGSYSLILIRK